MNIKRIILPLLMMLSLIISCCATAFAEEQSENADYYRIRVYGGKLQPGLVYDQLQKRSAGSETIDLSGDVGIGKKIDIIKNGNTKSYFVKSVLRESGRERTEDEERAQLFALPVTKDQDYVLVYEVIRDEAKYYVDYLDTSGNPLRPRGGPYYANVGDEVYVAAAEITGYTPDARFHTNTDGVTDGYVFTFRYTRTPTTTGGGGGTATTGGGGGGAAVAGGAAANANAANPNAANPNAANPDANNPADNTNTPTQPVMPAAPLDIIDEAEVPLAAPAFGMVGTAKVPSAPKVIEPNQSGSIPNWMLIAGTVVLVGLISVLYWYLLFYRKKKKYASINDDYEILGFDDDRF
jgi:hypothetical protein